MSIVVFEDPQCELLAPITLARLAATMTCGSFRLVDLVGHLCDEIYGISRPHLHTLQRIDFPALRLLDEIPIDSKRQERSVKLLLNARIAPTKKNYLRIQQLYRAACQSAPNSNPMVVRDLNITGDGYLGVRAYGLSKRAQVMLTAYWREKYAQTGMDFYVMHPGWVDTAAVGRSMPRFRAMLKSVLREHYQGADTIVWLADRRPRQEAVESIWFDRKERPVHIYEHTPKSKATRAELVEFLESKRLAG
jgi:NAD(P)-dependent dehydrogenase (short-subunit alcohol dehydrogenase family)